MLTRVNPTIPATSVTVTPTPVDVVLLTLGPSEKACLVGDVVLQDALTAYGQVCPIMQADAKTVQSLTAEVSVTK